MPLLDRRYWEGFAVSHLPAVGLLEVLQRVPDPRGRFGKRHPLSAMLAAVVCARLCGFRGIQPVVQWLELHGPAMWHLLGYRRKPPVRQTYANVLAELDPEQLEALLLEFVEQCGASEVPPVPSAKRVTTTSAATDVAGPLDTEIWDGKTLRGTRRGDQRAEQVLVRMQRTLGRILASHAIPANTNETTVALELVKRLVLKGKLIEADAAYCQRELCETIVEKEGDYLVTVKGNQPQLLRDVQQAFVIPEGGQAALFRRGVSIRRDSLLTEQHPQTIRPRRSPRPGATIA